VIDEWSLVKRSGPAKGLRVEETAIGSSLIVIKFAHRLSRLVWRQKPSGRKQPYGVLESLLRDSEVQRFYR